MANATRGILMALALVGAATVAAGEVREARKDSGLASRMEPVLRTPGYERGRWGLLVVDSATGEVLYEKDADRMVRPASVTKLFSAATAQSAFGPDHRFLTPIVHTGKLDKATGRLEGDLILVAQGDPSLGGRTGPDGTLLFEDHDHIYAGPKSTTTIVANADPLGGLDHLAREVAAAGVKTVAGNIWVDDRLFDEAEGTGSGPRRLTPIMVNDNLIDVVVNPASKPGEPAKVRFVPETSFAVVDARVETGESSSARRLLVERVGARGFVVKGSVPVGGGTSYQAYEVAEPADFARALLIECLRRRGVAVEASPLDRNQTAALPSRQAVAGLPELARYTSPPLREYLKVILKVSHNLHASTLPLLLAAKEGQRTLDQGLAIEGKILRELGVDLASVSFGGGAGGSPSDLVTPRATVALLRAMAARPDFPAFEAALPILGRDGTLAQAVGPDSPARGHVRAKTGTFTVRDALTDSYILTSKALAGYMETASGRRLTFAYFLNDTPLDPEVDLDDATAEAGRLLGRLCEAVYADTAASEPPKVDGSGPGGKPSGGPVAGEAPGAGAAVPGDGR